MSKFAKVCLILTAVFAAIGVMMCGIGAAAGATRLSTREELSDTRLGDWWDYFTEWNWDWSWDDGWIWNDGWEWDGESNGIGTTETYSYNQDEVRNLDININAGELKIEKSTDDEIHVKVYSRRSKVTVEANNKTLTIDEKSTNYRINRTLEITLSIPEGMEFDKISMQAKAGEIKSSYKDLEAKTVNLKVDAGEMVIDNLFAEENLDVTVGAGNADITNLNAKDVDLDCGLGELKLQGTVTGNLNGKSGVGTLEMLINGWEDDFNYKLTCGIGSITVDGNSFGALGSSKTLNNNAKQDMTLDCGVGTIEVIFE